MSECQNREQHGYRYAGDELEVFALAANWKAYCRSRLKPHVRGDVLEIGAGIGGTTRFLHDGDQSSWLCVEPDAGLAAVLERTLGAEWPGVTPEVLVGSIADVPQARGFDTILYIDVLEHIPDDRAELALAAARLRPGGRLVVLSPAHNILFSEFDQAIGHFRRYNRGLLQALAPPGLGLLELYYLDAVGMILSLANRWVLRSPRPTFAQIRFWDRRLIPCSRLLDPLLGRRLGKTIVAVWVKPGSREHMGPT
jgi:SAM-dependent methyltransferase